MRKNKLRRAGLDLYLDSMRTNEQLVRFLVEYGYANDRVAEAMLKYPREIFLPEYQKKNAYYDIPLLIGEEQTCSAPSMVAIMLSLLNIAYGMKILEIGTGSGWQTALLSELVGPSGRVVSVELINRFSDNVLRNLNKLKISNVKLIVGDGKQGYAKLAPYDRIIVSAAAKQVQPAWRKQLKENGIIILPIGESQYSQHLCKGIKKDGEIKLNKIMPVAFVNLM